MKVVQTNSLINANDWLVLVHEKEKRAQFVKVGKVSDVSHTGVAVQNGLGDWLSIDAGGGAVETVKESDEQNVYFLKDISRGQSPLYLFLGDDPIFSNPHLKISLHIWDSEFTQPSVVDVPCSAFSPLGSNFSVQLSSFARIGLTFDGVCNTGAHKDVHITHVQMTWE